MNVDTDTQWAYWDGLRGFYKKNEGYLQGQVRLNAKNPLPENTLYSLTYVKIGKPVRCLFSFLGHDA